MKTAVGQVMVVGGHLYGEASNTLVDERRAQGRDRGSLYVLVELPGQPRTGEPTSLAGQLAGVVHQVYYGQRASVTAGLQQAVREANRLLFEENRNALPGERQTAGLSVAVLRHDDLFIAQAGPAAALIAHAGQVSRFPEVSPWLDAGPDLALGPAVLASLPPDEQDSPPLGDRSDINVALYHVQVEPGDFVLLLETAAARCLQPDAWPAVLDAGRAGGAQAALDALLAAVPACDLSAVALALGDAVSLPSTAGASATPARGSAPAPRPPLPALADRVAAGGTQIPFQARLDAVLRPLAAALWSAAARTGAALRGVFPRLWGALLVLLRHLMPGRIASARTGGPAARGPARPAARGPARPAPGRRPASRAERSARPAPRLRAPGDSIQKLLIVVAVAIPLIVAVVVGVTLSARATNRRAELDALWQQADASWRQANASTDQAAARTALLATQATLDSLLQRQPDRPGAADLRAKVLARLDELGKVKRIAALTELAAYPADADLIRVVVQGLHVFVLDRKGKVYHHQLEAGQKGLIPSSQAAVLVSRGQTVGSIVVGDLVDMVWIGVDADNVRERPALVVLESGGFLLEYDPTTDELNVLTVGGRDLRQVPKWVGSHTGRLYLVDVSAGKVWRYAPTGDGYNGVPDDWLTTPIDLAGVTDVAVGDGIYLAYGDSHILKLMRGEAAAYPVSSWDTLPRGPRALATYPPDETESVYIADNGNARIVQTGPDGKFTRQYLVAEGQPDVLRDITSLFVDGNVGRAFFTSGGRLYLATLPK